jgi:hypothetical protein
MILLAISQSKAATHLLQKSARSAAADDVAASSRRERGRLRWQGHFSKNDF